MMIDIILGILVWIAICVAFMAHVRIGVLQEEINVLHRRVLHPAFHPYPWEAIDG